MNFCLVLIYTLFHTANCSLTIGINGISEIKGKIQIGIYNDPDKFPDINGQYRLEYLTVTTTEMTYEIRDLPNGDYAVALFHDVNSDGICNLNFLGIPTEPYGFSNNVMPVLKAPSFNAAKISINRNEMIVINLIK